MSRFVRGQSWSRHLFCLSYLDDAPPVFNACPPSTTVPTDPGQSYATVSFAFPSPSDDRSNPTLVGSHAPNSQFPLGPTTVTYTAYDSAGQSTDCVFVITVEGKKSRVGQDYEMKSSIAMLRTVQFSYIFRLHSSSLFLTDFFVVVLEWREFDPRRSF